MRPPRAFAYLIAATCLANAGTALAHDTWFEALDATAQERTLALGTGNRYPIVETAIDKQYLALRACKSDDGALRPLDVVRYDERTTLLRARIDPAVSVTCFVQLQPFDIELPPEKVAVYFREIRPSEGVLKAWADMQARGLPFRERYIKSARIDFGARASTVRTGTLMDVLRVAPAGALQVDHEATFQVLRAGQPLADFAVEFINERSPLGLWQRTDANGLVRVRLPLPGRWLMRGTHLHLAPGDATRWESEFVTYAFDVGAKN